LVAPAPTPALLAQFPTFTAFAVTALLEKHFPDLVDTGFTARMEQTLDDISTGEAEWLPYLREFYLGELGLENQVKQREDQIDPNEARAVDLEGLTAKVRIGKYGAYLEAENDDGPIKASIPQDLTPADLDPEQVEVLLRQKTEGPDKVGFHPETGEPIYLMIGSYGPYVQLGDISDANPKPKRASLPKGVSSQSVTLEMAVSLLALPRALGTHPDTGGKIQASLGRFGPYVVHDQGKEGKDYRSLKAEDNVLTITLERALELLAQPKAGRGRSKAAKPLRELGNHPADQEPINIYDGPYGPYVKHGKTNASLPEGESVESLTLENAVKILAAKAGTKTKTGRTSSKTAAANDKVSKSATTDSQTTNGAASTTGKTTKTGKATKATSTKTASTKTASTEKTSKKSTAQSTTTGSKRKSTKA
jgi:DNA topoisomerase I